MNKVWIALVILTTFAFGVGYFELVSSTLVVILLISTFFKGQLVIDYFMDLKDVELKYRLIPSIWLLSIIITISYNYYKSVF